MRTLTASLIALLCLTASAAAYDPYPFQRSDGLWGYVDDDHCWVISPEFRSAEFFSDGLALIETPEKGYAYIDLSGDVAINRKFSFASSFAEGLAAVSEYDEYGDAVGYIDLRGNFVIKPSYQMASPFSEGLAVVAVLGKEGFIDRSGNLAISKTFDYAMPFSNGVAWVNSDGGFYMINRAGDALSEATPLWPPQRTSEGYGAFEMSSGLWGYWDQLGNIVIDPQFESAAPFSEGLAAVQQNGKYGFIAKSGQFQVPPIYKGIRRGFQGGLATVETDTLQYAVIDKLGHQLADPTCDHTR